MHCLLFLLMELMALISVRSKKQFLLTMQIENKEQYPDNFDAKWLYKLKQLSVVSIASKQRVGSNFF
jgi:hypothetical protein